MSGIVVGVDGSPHSQKALDWALAESTLRHAPLTVLAVSPVAASAWTHASLHYGGDEDVRAQVEQATREIVDKAVTHSDPAYGQQVTVQVVSGVAADELIKASEDADLVVVGARGAGGARRAAVSSFGFGGANAHAVLEEFVAAEPPASVPGPVLVPLSARDDARLGAPAAALRDHFKCAKPAWATRLPEIACTLQAGREAHREVRRALVVSTLDDLIRGLILLARWALVVPLVMIEGRGVREAFGRSSELVTGRTGRVLLLMLVANVITGVGGIVITEIFLFLPPFGAAWAGSAVAGALTVPYEAHVLSVLYYRLTDPGRPVLPA